MVLIQGEFYTIQFHYLGIEIYYEGQFEHVDEDRLLVFSGLSRYENGELTETIHRARFNPFDKDFIKRNPS
jgi:hypothetical protein